MPLRYCFATLALAILTAVRSVSGQPPIVAQERDVDVSTFTGVLQESYADGRPKAWKQLLNGQANGL